MYSNGSVKSCLQGPFAKSANNFATVNGRFQRPNYPMGRPHDSQRRMSGPSRTNSQYNNYWPQTSRTGCRVDSPEIESNAPHPTPSASSASSEPIYVLKSQDVRVQSEGSARNGDATRQPWTKPNTSRNFFNTGTRPVTNATTQPRHSQPRKAFASLCHTFQEDLQAKIFGLKQSVTYCYIGRPGQLHPGDRNNRVVWLGYIEHGLFGTHSLRDMMSRCGEVEMIHFTCLKAGGMGYAFVT